jgi:hypothetical protein
MFLQAKHLFSFTGLPLMLGMKFTGLLQALQINWHKITTGAENALAQD